MAKRREDEEELGDIRFEREIDPITGFAHHSTTFPVPPVEPEPPAPPGPMLLQRHPYLGPIIASIIGAVVLIVLFILGRR